ncbi:MAG TPA: hypothetical protein VMU39_12580 [Solirubrobacteraceae bacterium]|nr:hypothetical protein [Solirubrobacteraceae bacterium]
MSSLLDRLRPHPHRGDVIAAGAVPLALAAIVIELQMTQWSLGPRFAVVALITAVLLTMGWLAPLEGDAPRVYHSVLLVCGLLPLIVALVLLAEILGATRPPGAGGLSWVFAVEALAAAASARRFNSGVCTLIAALAGAVAVEAVVVWIFAPHGLGTARAILFALALAFTAGAIRLRDHRRRHAVQLVNAAGLASLALAATYLLAATVQTTVAVGPGGEVQRTVHHASGVPFGWELFLLAIGFGLVAYASVDREPGPAYLGAAVLIAFAVLVGLPSSHRGTLVGWPLFLLALGGVGLAIGLRPRQELPPPPGDGPGAETVPLRRET